MERSRPWGRLTVGILFIFLTVMGEFSSAQTCASVFDLDRPKSPVLSFLFQSAEAITAREIGMNPEKMIEALRQDPHYRWIAEDLLQENISFAMNRRETSRTGIATRGFLNMYEANRSTTGMTKEERADLEAAMSGLSAEEYRSKVPIEERPLYGYLAPKIGSSLRRESEVQGYGTDIYVFKKQNLREDTTWTLGDSLDRDLSLSINGKYLRVPRLHRFMPWSKRGLMLPRLRAKSADRAPEELALYDFSSWVTLPNGKELSYNSDAQHGYVELQFWRTQDRKITLDDVESFIFSGNPPEGDFLKQLRIRGIPIYRHRNGKDRLWTER
jgi:hypothetical protein